MSLKSIETIVAGYWTSSNDEFTFSPSPLMDVADKAKDKATSGLIDTWTDEAERYAWFLFEVSR